MNTSLKAAISLITLGGASFGGYTLLNSYNENPPINKPKFSLSFTKEPFESNTLGHKFPTFFLSTTAAGNDKNWEDKKSKIKDSWPATDSFFKDIKKSDGDAVSKIKNACMAAYKTQIPDPKENNSGDFLLKEDKWKEVWRMCGRLT